MTKRDGVTLNNVQEKLVCVRRVRHLELFLNRTANDAQKADNVYCCCCRTILYHYGPLEWGAKFHTHTHTFPMYIYHHNVQQWTHVLHSANSAVTVVLSFNRTQYRAVIGLLIGHNTLRRHLYAKGLSNSLTCRKCGTEEET
jgi:hypothetical protein